MPLVVVNYGQRRFLNEVLAAVPLRAGLFKNDRTPKPADVIGDYTEADFSGYDGVKNLTAWTAAVTIAGHGSSSANGVTWTHNGGPTDNLIYGVFVIDNTGALVWAERNPFGPVLVRPANPVFSYSPVFVDTTEYAG